MKKKISILEDSIKRLVLYSILFFIIAVVAGFAVIKHNYNDEIEYIENNYKAQLDLSSNKVFQQELENIKMYLKYEYAYLENYSKEFIDSVSKFAANFYLIDENKFFKLFKDTNYPIEIKMQKGIDYTYPYYAKYLELSDNKYIKISLNDKKYLESQERIAKKNIKKLHSIANISLETNILKDDFSFIGENDWYCENYNSSYNCYDKNWLLELKFKLDTKSLIQELEKEKAKKYESFIFNVFFLILSILSGFSLLCLFILNRKKEVKKQIKLTSKYLNLALNSDSFSDKKFKLNDINFKYVEFRTLGYIFLNFLRTIKTKNKDIKKQAYTDNVTGLMNITSVHDKLEHYEKKQGKVLLFCFFNVDNFRVCNSMYGRDFGNEILKVVGFRIYATLKNIPLDNNEYQKANEYKKLEKYNFNNKNSLECIARVSADEFLLVLELDENEDFEKIISKYQSGVTNNNIYIESNDELIKYEPFKINIRIGYSIYPKDSDKILECIGNSDMAIENDKAIGKNGIYKYTSEIGKENEEYLQLQKDIRHGILNKEFILFYQAKVDCKTGKIVGAEALARWKKDGKIIPPNVFIEACEKSNLIIALGNEIIKMACDAQRRWIAQGLRLKLSINLSTKQLLSNGLIQVIENNIQGIDPKLLEFEITESFSIENETSKNVIDSIKKLNVSLSMDDFGKGYSSLSYLNDKDLDFDVIKIDKCFIQNIDTNEKNRKLVEFIINLTKVLGKRSVAEGVDDVKILYFLQELGCDEYQGYYFSKPVSEEEFLERLKND